MDPNHSLRGNCDSPPGRVFAWQLLIPNQKEKKYFSSGVVSTKTIQLVLQSSSSFPERQPQSRASCLHVLSPPLSRNECSDVVYFPSLRCRGKRMSVKLTTATASSFSVELQSSPKLTQRRIRRCWFQNYSYFDLGLDLQGRIQGQMTGDALTPKLSGAQLSERPQSICTRHQVKQPLPSAAHQEWVWKEALAYRAATLHNSLPPDVSNAQKSRTPFGKALKQHMLNPGYVIVLRSLSFAPTSWLRRMYGSLYARIWYVKNLFLYLSYSFCLLLSDKDQPFYLSNNHF